MGWNWVGPCLSYGKPQTRQLGFVAPTSNTTKKNTHHMNPFLCIFITQVHIVIVQSTCYTYFTDLGNFGLSTGGRRLRPWHPTKRRYEPRRRRCSRSGWQPHSPRLSVSFCAFSPKLCRIHWYTSVYCECHEHAICRNSICRNPHCLHSTCSPAKDSRDYSSSSSVPAGGHSSFCALFVPETFCLPELSLWFVRTDECPNNLRARLSPHRITI